MAAGASTITVRRPTFDVTDLPRRWVGGSRLGTWFGNAGHVFIPLGERMFVDAVKAFREQLDDPDLRREVAAFIGQESVHARVHERVWDELRYQGVPVDAYAAWIEWFRSRLEPHVPAALLLSITAALEHYTAVFGETFLAEDLTDVLPGEMAALLEWHGAEEIEHRSVAFDVLQEVDGDRALRVAGMAAATALLTLVPLVGVGWFALADLFRGRNVVPSPPNPRLAGITVRFGARLVTEVGRYLVPGFRPGDRPASAAYERWELDRAG